MEDIIRDAMGKVKASDSDAEVWDALAEVYQRGATDGRKALLAELEKQGFLMDQSK